MTPTHEGIDEQCALDAIRIEEADGACLYVLYPLNATDEELRTAWIRSTENDMARLADRL